MPIASSAHIHPTALISADAEIGENVQVGPYVIIEGPVRVGPDCVLKSGAHLFGPMTMGQGNVVHSHAVLGEQPQHLRYRGEPTLLEIGDHNIFRECATVHRGMAPSGITRIGNHNFLMVCSHVAHDCQIGNHCILANSALLAGHIILEDGVCISGNTVLHQFCRVGRLALLSGLSGTSMDIPPFIIQQRYNCVVGVNVVGMRRGGVPTANINAVRQAFHIIYRSGMLLPQALAKIEAELSHVPEVAEMLEFIRSSKRGINLQIDRDAAAMQTDLNAA
jgi:UDP-N-acetylglucosamine acyltransferase